MTYFFDLDGTLLCYHKNEWIAGANYMLKDLEKQGHDVILITARGERDANEEWSVENTKKFLAAEGIEYPIMFGVESPRVLVDDVKPKAVHVRKNQIWNGGKKDLL